MTDQVAADMNSRGDGSHFRATVTFGSGISTIWFRHDVFRSLKKVSRQLIEYLPFERNSLPENKVKCRNPVCRDQDQVFSLGVGVAHLSW